MKHLFTLACCFGLMALYHTASAQMTIVEGHAWSTNECLFWSGCQPAVHRIQGDTLIDGIAYKKVHTGPGLIGDNINVFAAREDVENKKVYFVNHLGEYLAYDFNLEVGDFIAEYCGQGPMEVIDVDFITLLNGEQRKRIHFFSETWIEGLGSSYGLTYPFFDQCLTDIGSEVICFYAGLEMLWQGEEFDDCVFDPLNVEPSAPLMAFSVYPNPAKDALTLHFANATESSDLLQLISVDGRLIRSERPGVVQSLRMDLHGLPPGMYLLKLLGTNGTGLARVVKE